MDELVYNKTTSKEGNDCHITKNAHILKVKVDSWTTSYIVTCSTIYTGYMDFDTMSQSFVYDEEHIDEALDCCENFLADY